MPDPAKAASLTAPPAARPERPGVADVEKFLNLDDERRRLGREARALAKIQDKLSSWFRAAIIHAGNKTRRIKLPGYEISLVTVETQRRPDYRAHLIDAIGEARVLTLEAQAPVAFAEKIEVRKLAA